MARRTLARRSTSRSRSVQLRDASGKFTRSKSSRTSTVAAEYSDETRRVRVVASVSRRAAGRALQTVAVGAAVGLAFVGAGYGWSASKR